MPTYVLCVATGKRARRYEVGEQFKPHTDNKQLSVIVPLSPPGAFEGQTDATQTSVFDQITTCFSLAYALPFASKAAAQLFGRALQATRPGSAPRVCATI